MKFILVLRVIVRACVCVSVAEAHKYYGEALVNGQKLVAIDPCKEK